MSYNINDTCHTNEIPYLEYHYYTGWSIIMNQSIHKLLNKMKSEKILHFYYNVSTSTNLNSILKVKKLVLISQRGQ